MTATQAQAPIAITMGDPAGIGPEIVVKAFRDFPIDTAGCFAVGDLATMRRAAQAIDGVELPIALIETPQQALTVPPRCMGLLAIGTLDRVVAWGKVSPQAGKSAADCVTWAARAALRSEIAAMVTAPLHKEALAAAGVNFPGHTELLQAEAAAWMGRDVAQVPVRMMLANDELRTVLVSIHVSLRDALAAVTLDNVLQTLLITNEALSRALGRRPHIGVAGLNPHAGEGGLFGDEEIDVIIPAVEMARAEGLQVSGPFAPDTVFMRARSAPGKRGEFDVVIAMYHDQGLIPVKYLGVERGVNVTLGLPLIRTSPDHGTAFDIAGTGRADPGSLVEAIRVARRMSAG